MKTNSIKTEKEKSSNSKQDKMKTLIPAIIIIVLLSVYFMITGNKKMDVVLQDYEIYKQEGITVMALDVAVTDSSGYVRTLSLEEENENLYITFYSTFGFNNDQGAANKFPVEITPAYEKIYFYDSSEKSGFRQVLQLNAETGEWDIIK